MNAPSSADASPRPSPWRSPLVQAFGIALAVWAVAMALEAVVNRVEAGLGDGVRFVPAMKTALGGLLASLVIVPQVVFARSRVWPRLKELVPGRRIAWFAGLLVLQIALFVGLLLVAVSTQHNWPFVTPAPSSSLSSPDGRRTAYLTMDCLLGCSVTVHVREGWSPVMKRTVLVQDVAREPLPRMVWSADSTAVEVRDVVKVPPVGLGFGPH